MTDFIIVGRGLAAAVLMHQLESCGLTFTTVGDPALSASSRVAAGIWHPVVFKRLTKSWMAETLIPRLLDFYRECEQRLGVSLITERKLVRPFGEEQEKALWKRKAAAELAGFIDPNIYNDIPAGWEHCRMPNGYGIVNRCGNLDVRKFIDATEAFFSERIVTARFDHTMLQPGPDHVRYKHLQAKQVVFCEGRMVTENPFFRWVPMRLAKGEVLTVESDKIRFDRVILNKNGFLMDLGERKFRLGATYEWDVLDDTPTREGAAELRSKLDGMVDCSCKVLDHEAGVRPSSIDRRPIMGSHPLHPRLLLFNGLGTKGVMLAPWFAAKFVNFCRWQEPLNPEVNVSRFYGLYDAEQKA